MDLDSLTALCFFSAIGGTLGILFSSMGIAGFDRSISVKKRQEMNLPRDLPLRIESKDRSAYLNKTQLNSLRMYRLARMVSVLFVMLSMLAIVAHLLGVY